MTRRRTLAALMLISLLVALPLAAEAQHRLFVTSSTGTADLSTWDDADGEIGLRAADAICRAHAQRAGLADPASFVAWLSDSNDDAYCRAHGLSGKRADDCGQGSLPSGAGPWVRTDGFPFGGPLEDVLAPTAAALAPTALDENGDRFTGFYYTGTGSQGQGSESPCADWTDGTSSDLFVTVGNARATGRSWSAGGATICSSPRPLLCMQAGSGPALPPYEESGARVFVTVESRSGDLSSWPGADGATGLAAGDAICRSQAAAYDLEDPETFEAWLSDGTTDAGTRLKSDGPWVRLDGVPVAQNRADLLDGILFAPINLDPAGFYRSNSSVWTGSTPFGLATEERCEDWSTGSADVQGNYGVANDSVRWSSLPSPRTCNGNSRLYCIQDAAPRGGGCLADDDTLCLGAGGRFALEITWETADDTGVGQAVDIARRDSGLFTFFDPNNLELLVKVLEGCSLTDHYWLFYGATTDQGFELIVTDTQTGAQNVYTNPLGVSAEPVKDFFAFPCEP